MYFSNTCVCYRLILQNKRVPGPGFLDLSVFTKCSSTGSDALFIAEQNSFCNFGREHYD